MKTFSHLWKYLAEFFLESGMFQIKCLDNIKTHISCSINFFRKLCRLWDDVEKFGKEIGHKRRSTITHARCMLGKQGYMRARTWTSPRARAPTHTHAPTCAHTLTEICNTYCVSTAAMVSCSFSWLPVNIILFKSSNASHSSVKMPFLLHSFQ